MDDYRNHNEPWDPSIYGTGRTRPPKNHGGIIAVLLVIVIFLGGLVSVLGILNVRLFTQLKDQSREQEQSLSFVSEAESATLETSPMESGAESQVAYPHDPSALELNPTPGAVPNISQEGGLPLQQI